MLKKIIMATFLLIGKSFIRLTEYLESHNHNFIVLVDSANNFSSKADTTYACDFSSIDNVIETAHKIDRLHNINGVIAIYENYVLPAAQIAKALKLPGLTIESAEACTDKEIMRNKFAAAPEKISPDFKLVSNKNDLIEFANQHQFPLILKPTNLVKSLLVTKANSMDQLVANYELTLGHIDEVYKKYAPNRQPKLLVEEFIHGSIHSVDAFIDKNGKVMVLDQVVDYETGQEIGFDDNFHYSRLLPSNLNQTDIDKIRHVAELGCRALGMTNSPAHIEIILSPDGPRVVEIGARNGGYRERMHDFANGIDIVGSALAIALGKEPDIKALRNDYCTVLEIFPKEEGIFVDIENDDKIRKLSTLVYYMKKVKTGALVGKASDGFKACAVIILHSTDENQFNEDSNYIRNNVSVKIA